MIHEKMIRVPYDYTEKTLKRVWDDFQQVRNNRRDVLDAYYRGDQDITNKSKGSKIVVNFSRQIVDALAEYMCGTTPEYKDDANDQKNKDIINRMIELGLPDVEVDQLRNMGIMGLAYELVYHDTDPGDKSEASQTSTSDVKSVFLDPLDTFVAWDNSVVPDSIFGAYVWVVENDDDTVDRHMRLYTQNSEEEWVAKSSDRSVSFGDFTQVYIRPHNFGRVPITEYRTDKYYTSDIEEIISLQDAYNMCMSDSQDAQDAFAQVMLVLGGGAQLLDSYKDTDLSESQQYDESKKHLKDIAVLELRHANDTANYLTRQTNETEVKIHLDTIEDKLREMARTPNFNDESFAGNASGVALKYKLYFLNLKAMARQRAYSNGFRRRVKLFAWGMENAMMDSNFEPSNRIEDIDIVFHMTTVNDPLSDAQVLQTLKGTGLYSDQTIREQFGLGVDEDTEIKRIAEQHDIETKRETEYLKNEFGQNATPDIDEDV